MVTTINDLLLEILAEWRPYPIDSSKAKPIWYSEPGSNREWRVLVEGTPSGIYVSISEYTDGKPGCYLGFPAHSPLCLQQQLSSVLPRGE